MSRNYDDFTRLTCDTVIKEKTEDGYYVFEDTVFYGEKGGMLADKGTINGLPVTDLKWKDDVLYHKVEGDLSNPIHMAVDERERWINTSVQTALHMFDGFFRKKGLPVGSIGVHQDNQWYEVNSKDVDDAMLEELQQTIDRAIQEDIKVEFTYVPGNEYPDEHYHHLDEVRIVKIGDYDCQPCGTLHLNSTGQIGSFVILDSEKTSRGTRIYFTCNHVTDSRLKEYHHIIKDLGHKLNSRKENIVEKVEQLADSQKALKKQLDEANKQLARYKAEDILKQTDKIIETTASDANELRNIAQAVMNRVQGTVILIADIDSLGNIAVISGENKARELFEKIKGLTTVAGGGSPKMATGKTELPLAQLKDLLKELDF